MATNAPNILYIMADDLGWANVGFHNDENPQIHTPNMDALVDSGLELTRHYVSSLGTPSRASFQTGRLPVHVKMAETDGLSGGTHGIPEGMTAIASKLKSSPSAYSTHLVGKWDCGFASYSQLPTRKGYDSFLGYLSKSMDYFRKTAISKDCGEDQLIALWDGEQPVTEVDDSTYSELEFAERVHQLLDLHDDAEGPFFIMYSSHLPHAPLQIPEDLLIEDSEDDTSLCLQLIESVYPGFELETDPEVHCRAILQSQVNLLDVIIGDIVGKLKALELWDNTLLVFTTDNGGSLALDETAGNNYPLRGGKSTKFEGGIRATTFVNGGYLPDSRRGQKEGGLVSIADWYVTFAEMAGAEASDTEAVAMGLPDVDGFNIWPLIKGEVSSSPRTELVVDPTVLITGAFKLNTGVSKYAFWQGSVFPNASTPDRDVLSSMVLNCRNNGHGGCLFNVEEDPSEYNDLADSEKVLFGEMKSRLTALSSEIFKATSHAMDSCPDDIEEGMSCGCWMAHNNYDDALGPYQDLSENQKAFLRIHDEEMVNGDEHEREVHLYIVLIIIVCSVVIVISSMYYCYRWDRRIERNKKCAPGKEKERQPLLSEYGAVDVGTQQHERNEYAHDHGANVVVDRNNGHRFGQRTTI